MEGTRGVGRRDAEIQGCCMITGTPTWETDLANDQKKPLYALVIDSLAVHILSFDPVAESVSTSGGYGTSYGTAYGSS